MFMFFIIPISLGLTVLGTETILIYGSEKYVEGGLLTSLFAFRTIFLSLDIILGTQIIFAHGYEKQLTIFTLFSGIINILLDSLLFMNNISKPELYLITTMVSEVILLIIYSRFIIKKQLISLKNIFHYTMRYFMFSLTFIPIYYIVNIINPTEMIITSKLIVNIVIIIILSITSYTFLLYITNDAILQEVFEHFKKIKNKIC